MLNLFQRQPRAFFLIFMLELWERFGFYTMQGILALYFMRQLGFNETLAYHTFGAFSALVYGMVALGGYLGDKILGTKRSIVLGLITLALGYLALALLDKSHIFLALGLICVGNGIFKANPAHLLSKFYEKNDPRLHSAFTLYYMAVNLGSIFALFLGPILASRYGYAYAYLASFCGLMIGLANYYLQRHYFDAVNTAADRQKIPLWQWNLIIIAILVLTQICAYLLQHIGLAQYLVWAVVLFVTGIYFKLMRAQDHRTRRKMGVALILMVEGILFFTLYQQMPTSINLFAVNHVRPFLFGFAIEPQSFQALNPIWIMVLSPALALFYPWLSKRGLSIATPYKFALGMGCSGLGFIFLYLPIYAHDEAGMVAGGWLLVSYLFQSLGELLVSALGVAMVAELLPVQMVGFVMGMWFLSTSIAGFMGAYVASFTVPHGDLTTGLGSLLTYTHTFAAIGLVTLSLSLLMWFLAPRLNQFISPSLLLDQNT